MNGEGVPRKHLPRGPITHNEFMGIPWSPTLLSVTPGPSFPQGTHRAALSSTGNPAHFCDPDLT